MRTLDQDRAFADALACAAQALVFLTEHAERHGEPAVRVLVHPDPEHPGALSAPLLADLLGHAATYVQEHTP